LIRCRTLTMAVAMSSRKVATMPVGLRQIQ
jgi:hypothetical protein